MEEKRWKEIILIHGRRCRFAAAVCAVKSGSRHNTTHNQTQQDRRLSSFDRTPKSWAHFLFHLTTLKGGYIIVCILIKVNDLILHLWWGTYQKMQEMTCEMRWDECESAGCWERVSEGSHRKGRNEIENKQENETDWQTGKQEEKGERTLRENGRLCSSRDTRVRRKMS